ncbi:MAG: hypothetical protein RSB88_03745 [Akkermansia sp.]
MQELLEDLESEYAYKWLLEHLVSDRQGDSTSHIYKTALFAIQVDFSTETVLVSAELGCHPDDEIFDLSEFVTIISSKLFLPRDQGKRVHVRGRGDHTVVHCFRS